MRFNLLFAPSASDPLSTVPFEQFQSDIKRGDGSQVFSMPMEAPRGWSQIAVDMIAQKYARKAGVPSETVAVEEPGVPDWLRPRRAAVGASLGSETDAKQLFHRLAGCWTYWGWKGGYFDAEDDARNFYADVLHSLATQRFAPNTPQWLNTGLNWAYGISSDDRGQWGFDGGSRDEPIGLVSNIDQYSRPASGACFIQGIEDNLVGDDGIMSLMLKEARVFRNGAGSGANYSKVRGTGEPLSGGGKSSGLPSFLEPIDRSAGAIKSGGTSRRAARMVVLDLNHPDIEWFVDWKADEEKKVAALAVGSRVLRASVDACYEAAKAKDDIRLSEVAAQSRALGVPSGTIDGVVKAARQGLDCPRVPHFDAGYEGAGYQVASGQNANNSVRVPDAFMKAVAEDRPWNLYWRTELEKANNEGREPKPCKSVPARALWHKVCYAAWESADPGVQYDTTINDWNTVLEDGRINGTNPCCLVGATLVDTTAGRVRIEDLVKTAADPKASLPDAYCWDAATGTFVTRRILKAWRAGETRDLIQVRCKSGMEVVATSDHRFMRDDGAYVEASELRPGDRLKTLAADSSAAGEVVASAGQLTTTSPVGVYDIEVDGVHNFAVVDTYHPDGNAVIVHNSEYNFLDDTTCNLASLNLCAFLEPETNRFDRQAMEDTTRIVTVVLDITVSMSSYPTAKVAANAAKYRTLGLGPMNLGALLMRVGVPYDSDAGRGWAVAIMGIMNLAAMRTSADLAESLGAFPRWEANAQHVRRVVENHIRYACGRKMDLEGVQPPSCREYLKAAKGAPDLRQAANETREHLSEKGWKLRNAQTTLSAPTGTIGLVTDCDTTGVEPDFALTKGKKLAGGGYMKIVNKSIGPALRNLGYDAIAAEEICTYVQLNDTIEGAPGLKKEHLPVFDCANRCGKLGKRSIDPMGHVRMLGALHPTVSGSISKSVNMPAEATYDDVVEVYAESHRLGVKCVAIYRDGSKLSQPLTSGLAFADAESQETLPNLFDRRRDVRAADKPAERRKLPARRTGHTQKVRIGAHKFYIRTGEYEDGSLGEIFIDVDKEGSMLRGVTNAFAKVSSIALQYGMPLEELVDAIRNTIFEPNGPVGSHDQVRMCTSFLDMIARHLQINYLGDQTAAHVPAEKPAKPKGRRLRAVPAVDEDDREVDEATRARLRGMKPVPCPNPNCQAWEMAPTGKCHTCQACGTTDGGCG